MRQVYLKSLCRIRPFGPAQIPDLLVYDLGERDGEVQVFPKSLVILMPNLPMPPPWNFLRPRVFGTMNLRICLAEGNYVLHLMYKSRRHR